MGFPSQHLLSSLQARRAEGRLGGLPVRVPRAGGGTRGLSPVWPSPSPYGLQHLAQPGPLSGETTLPHIPRASPGPTHVLASFPPYIRWASFSSSMSQYLLQNSVTSLPWSFTAFMGG